jgi:hypothetical protein
MMPDSFARCVSPLDGVAVALDRGDWRTATIGLFEGGAAGAHPELVDVVCCLRCISRGIKFQSVEANVQAAWCQVEAAVRKLDIDPQAKLGAEPARHLHDGLTHLRWATTRLVMREHADLAALRLIFEGLPRGRRELVYGALDHLTLIEFDPFTVCVHPQDRELTGLDDEAYRRWRAGNRLDICARASQLRQFASVRNGSVNDRAWHRAGGYPRVRELALRVLANEPVTRGRPEFPVRLGRLRAWHYARDWLEDTAA